MADELHPSLESLEANLPTVFAAPKDQGELQLLVQRPEPGQRVTIQRATLDPICGLVGDNWLSRGSRRTPDGSAHPGMQLTLMCSRVAQLVARTQERWALAGDQLFVDMDLSAANLPPGMRLTVGQALIEVSETPHTGCRKFIDRFGADAMKFLNTPIGRTHNLRGINAIVIQGGEVAVGDRVRKQAPIADS